MKNLLPKRIIIMGVLLSAIMISASNAQLIMKHPKNISECEGTATVSYSVVADTRGYNNISYQWQYLPYRSKIWSNVEPEAGNGTETQATLLLEFNKFNPLTRSFHNYQFRCVVSGTLNFSKLKTTETSNSAYLYVNSPPSIYSQPSGAVKFAGESVTFSIGATGATSFQWYKDGSIISGADESVFIIDNLTITNTGSYTCRVTNSCGYSNSNAANLTVNAPAYEDGWFEQPDPRTETIQQISAVTEFVAWAVFWDTDRLLYTADGGETWTPTQTSLTYNWRSIEFINEIKGFLGGYNGLGMTANGGASWDYLDLRSAFGISDPGAYFYVYDIEFINENTGFIVGSNGFIAKTIDGGANWVLQNFDGDQYPTINADLRSVYFVDENTGYASGYSGTIIKTSNGGNSWMKIETGVSDNFLDIFMLDENTGFATGGYYSLFKIMNGGSTILDYTSKATPQMRHLNSITFTDPMNGFIAGSFYDGEYRGCVARTNDGGETWYRQEFDPIEATTYMNDIVMIDENNGWAGGTNGNIWRTASGGCLNPVVDLGADQSFCASGNANLMADLGNLNCFYEWSSGSDAGQITVNTSGTYWVNVTNLCNVTATDTVNIYVFPLPEADAGEDIHVCKGDSTQLSASGGISYLWNNSQYLSADNIQNPICSPPQGSVEFMVTVTDENGCVNTDNLLVSVDDAFDQEKICIVTVDLETGKNMVVWEKTPDVGIASYNIYRLGTGGNYNLLGNIPFEDLSVFVDSTSEPEKTQYLYKLSVVDTCGNESQKSHYHKTLFLQYTSSEGGVNLLWQDYQIEDELVDFSDFYIYRGSDSTDLAVIDTVSGANVYTDVDPLANSQRMYYRVAGVKPDPCDPAGVLDKKAGSGPFVHSLSNLEDNRLKTNTKDILASKIQLQVYPNPFSEMTKLHFRLDLEANVKLEIYNILGEQIGVIANKQMSPGTHELTITNNDLQNKEGLYYVRLWLNDEYLTRKFIYRK